MQSFVKQEFELHQKLFGEMLDRYRINAKQLAETADVSETMVSRFRNGKTDLSAAKLLALLANIPIEARQWYLSQLLGVNLKTNLRSLILAASPQEKAEMLNVLADWVESRDSTDEINRVAETV